MAEIKFTPPAGFKTPNGTKEGEEFDTLATLRMEGDKLCLVAIDGVELVSYTHLTPPTTYSVYIPVYDVSTKYQKPTRSNPRIITPYTQT